MNDIVDLFLDREIIKLTSKCSGILCIVVTAFAYIFLSFSRDTDWSVELSQIIVYDPFLNGSCLLQAEQLLIACQSTVAPCVRANPYLPLAAKTHTPHCMQVFGTDLDFYKTVACFYYWSRLFQFSRTPDEARFARWCHLRFVDDAIDWAHLHGRWAQLLSCTVMLSCCFTRDGP